MSDLLCPNCSQTVDAARESCPSCGVDLERTRSPGVTAATLSTFEQQLDFAPGAIFADRFRIIERIGGGGMGVVYKAIDSAVEAMVALKLLHPSLAATPSFVERFRREVRTTRQITHPNVCRVHDIGTSGDILYLSMEWIDGETLQQLLRKTGTLREGRALEIANKIALALEAAHEKGIIHRDLKPANVMVDRRGEVRVLDFGLALEEGAESLSGPGRAVGTPLYMSPEQRRGADLDGRSDLYALGLILHEVLCGWPPTAGMPQDQPIDINPKIAPALLRLLADDRERRYPSAAAAREALEEILADPAISRHTTSADHSVDSNHGLRRRGIVASAGAAVLAIVLTVAFWPRQEPRFDNPDAEQYYERGVQYLKENLETVQGLDDARMMFHRALSAEPDSALAMARLAEVYWRRFEKTHSQASREEADRWLAEANKLDPTLAELHNARAFGYLVEGKYDAAETELQKALAVDDEFAMAWANLGTVCQFQGEYAPGLAAFDKAMKLEPGSFRMHLYRGLFHQHFQEYAEAEELYRRATELKEDSGIAWNNLGASLLHQARLDAAIPCFQRSIEIRDDASSRSNLGTAHYYLSEYDAAVEHYRRATELEPDEAVYWANLADTLLVMGKEKEARGAYGEAAARARKRVELEPVNPDARMRLAVYCAHAGDADCALENSELAARMLPDNVDFLLKNALVQCILGRDEDSLDWLDRAVKLGASRAQIEGYPAFARFHDNPRYEAIVELAS